MDTTLLSLHVFICVVLIILVLLQSGRDGMGVIFGGSGSQSSNAGSSGNLLTKLTASLAVIFVCTSLAYNIVTSTSDEESTILDVQFEETLPTTTTPETNIETPVTPAPAATETKTEIETSPTKITDEVDTETTTEATTETTTAQ